MVRVEDPEAVEEGAPEASVHKRLCCGACNGADLGLADRRGEAVRSSTVRERSRVVDSVEIKKYVEKHAKQSLDAEDIRVVRSIMLKYWKQLMKLSKLKLEKEKREDVGRAVSQEAVEVEVEEASDYSLLPADVAGLDCMPVCDLPPLDC